MDHLVHFVGSHSPVVTFIASSWALGTVYVLYLVLTHLDCRAIGTSPMRDDLEMIPGSWPIIGNLLRTIKTGDRQLETWIGLRRDQKDKSKSLTVTLPTLRIIDVTNPAAIEYVQKVNFANYAKGPLFGDVMRDILGEGIFAVDGEKWITARKATSKIFSANNFRGVIATSIDEDLATLRLILGRHADSGEPFDLSALFFDFTLSSFTKMAFSQDVGSLTLDTRPPVPFAAAFDFAQSQMARRFNNPFWRITEPYTKAGKQMKEASRVLDDFAFGIIKQREAEGLGNFTAENKKEAGNTDLLSLYMALRDDNGQPMNKRALRDAVLNLIIAGRDTTAQALSWTFFHLLTNPELITPLRQEADDNPTVDYDSYRSMTDTLATFHEGLRLHPSVPKNAWQALSDDKIPNGPVIKKGDLVRWSDWELGRMTEVWGEDAGTFRPSRWIQDGELKKESQWKFHAFNGGARLCLGQSLATLEATLVMATVVREFDLEFAPGYLANTEMNSTEATPRYQDSLTLPMLAPLRVVASRRKNL